MHLNHVDWMIILATQPLIVSLYPLIQPVHVVADIGHLAQLGD